MTAISCWAVLVAAGRGSRMASERPKQYLQVAGATVLEHSLGVLLGIDRIAGIAVVLAPDDSYAGGLAMLDHPRVMRVTGGSQRSDSVLAGLRHLQTVAVEPAWVLVHDAARPCVAPGDIERLIESALATGVGAILAEPVVDTIKRSADDGRVQQTLDRSELWRAQTPQMFPLHSLQAALEQAQQQGWPITDEAAAMELAQQPVQLVAATTPNPKITVPADLALAGLLLGQLAGEG